MKTEIEKHVLSGTASVKQSIKLMDDAGEGLLIILDESHRIKGLITDGDVRKGILKGVSLESPVEDILNTNPFVCKDDIPRPEIKKRLTELQRHCMPIVDDNNILVDVMFVKECETPKPEKKSNKVILMAGGKGSRLDPFTKILPKALIPLNDKPIIEMIMNNFQECGFQKFMISINHKADMIKNYFNHSTNNHDFEFVEETKRLGTVGALSLMRDKLTETFF
ncbi:CBS domain-containing protein, partial [Candidatus Woesearchaeota archaeon]|nr:CBS domain-containing protein [Candidatus Woesearchaeota archaeon]